MTNVVLVSRADRRPSVDLFPYQLRQELHSVPVPLRAPDGDAALDLQRLLTEVYDAAGYEDYIYTGAPNPVIRDEDQQWADQFVPPTR